LTANFNLNTLSVINTATNTNIGSLKVGFDPESLGNFIGEVEIACPRYTPSLSITADATGPICAKTKVTFTATAVDAGMPLTYTWSKNKKPVGDNSNTYVDSTLNTGDSVWCVINSSADNLTKPNAKSNVLKFAVNPQVTPAVTITASTAATICAGTPVNITATATGEGATPHYQWLKNNVNVGGNSNTYTTNAIANGDSVVCVVTSNAACLATTNGTSKALKFTVTATAPIQPSNIGGLKTVTAGQTNINYSVDDITGATFNWAFPAGVNIVSGQGKRKITVNWGSAPGTISVTANNICGASTPSQANVTIAGSFTATVGETNASVITNNLRFYPNPVTNKVSVEFTAGIEGKYEAQLVNTLGQLLQSKAAITVKGKNTVSFEMGGYASAMYYVRLIDIEHGVRILKVVKAK